MLAKAIGLKYQLRIGMIGIGSCVTGSAPWLNWKNGWF